MVLGTYHGSQEIVVNQFDRMPEPLIVPGVLRVGWNAAAPQHARGLDGRFGSVHCCSRREILIKLVVRICV